MFTVRALHIQWSFGARCRRPRLELSRRGIICDTSIWRLGAVVVAHRGSWDNRVRSEVGWGKIAEQINLATGKVSRLETVLRLVSLFFSVSLRRLESQVPLFLDNLVNASRRLFGCREKKNERLDCGQRSKVAGGSRGLRLWLWIAPLRVVGGGQGRDPVKCARKGLRSILTWFRGGPGVAST